MVAQELLSNWMESKLQLELSDGEEGVDSVLQEEPSAALVKYEHFDGESTAKQSWFPLWGSAGKGAQALWFVRLRASSCFEARTVDSVETRPNAMIFVPQLLQHLA